jgi:HK97 family phage prohead protease
MAHKHKPVSTKETRGVKTTSNTFEIRKKSDGSREVSGYAVKWGDLSEDLGGWRERHQKGAYTESLRSEEVLAYWSHDSNQILGRTSAGTLEVHEDETGVFYSLQVPPTTSGNDLIVSMERGDVRSSSFGFIVPSGGDNWSETSAGIIRTVTKALLLEVSPTGVPAFPTSDIVLRSAPAAIRAKLANRDVDDDDLSNGCDCDCDACNGCTAGDEEEASRNLLLTSLLLRRTQ